MMTFTNAVRSSNHSRCSPNTTVLDDRKIDLTTSLSFLSLITGSLLFLVGCGDESTVISTSTDSWYQAVDKDKHEFTLLPRFLYSPVKAELIDEASRAMSDGPLLQLSTKEAIRYADNRLRTVPEFRPFLIQGLYRTKRLFNILIADRALWVDSLDDPTDTAPVRRQPLVLYMDEVPPDVYVTVAWQAAENAATESAKNE